jgi:hypothetical protein
MTPRKARSRIHQHVRKLMGLNPAPDPYQKRAVIGLPRMSPDGSRAAMEACAAMSARGGSRHE